MLLKAMAQGLPNQWWHLFFSCCGVSETVGCSVSETVSECKGSIFCVYDSDMAALWIGLEGWLLGWLIFDGLPAISFSAASFVPKFTSLFTPNFIPTTAYFSLLCCTPQCFWCWWSFSQASATWPGRPQPNFGFIYRKLIPLHTFGQVWLSYQVFNQHQELFLPFFHFATFTKNTAAKVYLCTQDAKKERLYWLIDSWQPGLRQTRGCVGAKPVCSSVCSAASLDVINKVSFDCFPTFITEFVISWYSASAWMLTLPKLWFAPPTDLVQNVPDHEVHVEDKKISYLLGQIYSIVKDFTRN